MTSARIASETAGGNGAQRTVWQISSRCLDLRLRFTSFATDLAVYQDPKSMVDSRPPAKPMLMDVQTRNQCDSKRWQCRMQSQRGSRQLANSPRFHLHMTTRCLPCMRAFHSSTIRQRHGPHVARHSRHPNTSAPPAAGVSASGGCPRALVSTSPAGQSAPVYAASPEPPPGSSC